MKGKKGFRNLKLALCMVNSYSLGGGGGVEKPILS